MALNPNHGFEDLGDVKCAIVEKNCTPERVSFLKTLLEHNRFTVVVVASPPPKAAPKPAPKPVAEGETPAPVVEAAPEVKLPETFTVGVTDVSFSMVNAVYNRELKTLDGKVVTADYWKQKEAVSKEDEWYWGKN
jgi:hypothetical protein